MKKILFLILFPISVFCQVDKNGTNQDGNYDRLVPATSLITGKFFSGEVVKVKGKYGGQYMATDIPNSNWNNNVADSTFVFKVIDAAPDGENGFRMSETLDNQTYWVRGGTPDGFTVIADSDIAPDGSRTADRFVYVNSSPLRGNTNIAITAGQSYTVSLYIKVPVSPVNDDMKVRVELNDYSAGKATITPDIVNKGWARYSVTLTADADAASPFVDFDFGASGVDVGDTLVLWGLQFEPGMVASSYKRTETTPTVEGVLYLHYLPDNGTVVLDNVYNYKNLPDYQLIQLALNYCNAVENTSSVLLQQNRTLTDTITVPINVHLTGINTGNTVSGTWAKLKTKVFVNLNSTTKTAITFVGEGGDQLTAQGVNNIAFIPVSDGYALINTGNTINATLENIAVASWSTSNTRWLSYGIILGAGSLQNTLRNISLLHLKNTGVWSISSAIMDLQDVRVTEAIYGVKVSAAALYVNGLWAENVDSSAIWFDGNLCHINRLYTEDVPRDPGTLSNTIHIQDCSVFSVTNSDLQGGDLPLATGQTMIYLDSVRVATIASNQIQASDINLKTTVNTGYVYWVNNVESNNSTEKVIEGFTNVYDRHRIVVIQSTGQNSFIQSDNWMPRLKAESAILDQPFVTDGYMVNSIIGEDIFINTPTIKSSNENQFPWSEDLDQNFDYSGVYFTLTANDTVSFNGTNTAEKLLQNTTTDHYIYRNLTGTDTLIPGQFYTFSLYVANSGFNSIRLRVGGEDVDTIAITHSHAWQRVSCTFRKSETTPNNSIYYYFDGGTTNTYLHLDGYQFEKNVSIGEYIKTTGTALTAAPHFNVDGNSLTFDTNLKINSGELNNYTATQASALTPIEGMFIYVTDTNGTFTSKGFWGYTGAAWEKLNN